MPPSRRASGVVARGPALRHAVAALLLASSNARASGVLERLCAQADAAVMATDGEAFRTTGKPVLQWIGLSFPSWSAAQAGVLRGEGGALDLAGGGAPTGHAVAVLRLPSTEVPVVAVEGFDADGCARFRAGVGGSPPLGAAAWWARGACVSTVGRGTAALPAPSTKDEDRARALASFPATGLRATARGEFLRRFAGRRAARALGGVKGVAAWVDASSPSWSARWTTFHARAPVDASMLLPLPATIDVAEESALAVAFHPSGKARAPRTVPPSIADLLPGATVVVEVNGLDGEAPPGEWPFRVFGGAHAAFSDGKRARACVDAIEAEAKRGGFSADAGLWVKEARVLRTGSVDGRCDAWTGRTAARGAAMRRVATAEGGPFVAVRGDGRRIAGALEGATLLSDGDDLRAAVAVREAVGTSVRRVEAFEAWLWPAEGGRTWRGTATLEVPMGRR